VVTSILPDRPVADMSTGVTERHALHQAMRELSPRTRAVIVLRYVADLPEAEVAMILGCAVGTVKARASRGLAKLRAELGADVPLKTTTGSGK
jgi:RNA polymerase sigma factor (sigma-70 family)